jgi:hypothetical protein
MIIFLLLKSGLELVAIFDRYDAIPANHLLIRSDL